MRNTNYMGPECLITSIMLRTSELWKTQSRSQGPQEFEAGCTQVMASWMESNGEGWEKAGYT